MSENWYYEDDGSVYGPAPESDILALFAAGAIDAETRVCREGDNHWTSLISSPIQNPPPGPRTSDRPAPPQPASPQRSGSPMPGAPRQSKPSRIRSYALVAVLLLAGGTWYFFKDQIKLGVHRATSKDVRSINSILSLLAGMRAIHIEAAVRHPADAAGQGRFLISGLQNLDTSGSPGHVQVAFANYVQSWERQSTKSRDKTDFREILMLIGEGDRERRNRGALDNLSWTDLVSAYNSFAEAAWSESVYIKPVTNPR